MDFWKGHLGFHWWLNPVFKGLGVFSLMCGVSQFFNCFILESAGSGMRFMDPVSSLLVCHSCERNWLWKLDRSESFCFLTTVKDLNILEEHQLTSFVCQSFTVTGCLQQNVFKLLAVGSTCNGFTWSLSVSADALWGFFLFCWRAVESCGSWWSVVMLLWTSSSTAVISAQEVEENTKGNFLPSYLGTLSA